MARVRNKEYQRKAAIRADNIQKAADKVLSGKMSFREAAEFFSVSKSTLNRHVSNFKKKEQPNFSFRYVSQIQSRKFFTHEEELQLEDYILRTSMYKHGLTMKFIRILAYEYALVNKKNIPPNWEQEKMAGKDWYIGFKRRHSALFSLRKSTSRTDGPIPSTSSSIEINDESPIEDLADTKAFDT